jgi:hypothetical protein
MTKTNMLNNLSMIWVDSRSNKKFELWFEQENDIF